MCSSENEPRAYRMQTGQPSQLPIAAACVHTRYVFPSHIIRALSAPYGRAAPGGVLSYFSLGVDYVSQCCYCTTRSRNLLAEAKCN